MPFGSRKRDIAWYRKFITILVKGVIEVTRHVLVDAEVRTEKPVQVTSKFPCWEEPMPITAKVTAQMAPQKERLVKSFRLWRCVVRCFAPGSGAVLWCFWDALPAGSSFWCTLVAAEEFEYNQEHAFLAGGVRHMRLRQRFYFPARPTPAPRFKKQGKPDKFDANVSDAHVRSINSAERLLQLARWEIFLSSTFNIQNQVRKPETNSGAQADRPQCAQRASRTRPSSRQTNP